MKTEIPLSNSILEAVQAVRHFITETTGKEPSDEEIADAMKRYFVLNEIKAHILMTRKD
ncbi:hypothetical protein ACFL0M_14390 [Thermodesulfobacteriota bacterium]